MSTDWDIVSLYLCGFLENRFSGHATFVLATVKMWIIVHSSVLVVIFTHRIIQR